MKTTTPAFVSVPDAAAFLGFSRGLAYEQAREYLDTDGERGLVCVRLGHRLWYRRQSLNVSRHVHRG